MNAAGVTSKDIKLALAEKHHRDFFLTEEAEGHMLEERCADCPLSRLGV